VSEYRARGYLPEAINNYLALLSWAPEDTREVFQLDELAQAFAIDRISKSPAIFDINKLNWLNGQHIRSADLHRITNLCIPYLKEAGLIPEGEISKSEFEHLLKIIEAVRGNLTVLAEAPSYATIFLGKYGIHPEALEWLEKPRSHEVLTALRDLIDKRQQLDFEGGREVINAMRETFKARGVTGKDLFMPVRVGLTGVMKGPELPYVLNILDKDEAIRRVDAAIQKAKELQKS
jgi:glutamyl/glutaminyl-tRNA synthetase